MLRVHFGHLGVTPKVSTIGAHTAKKFMDRTIHFRLQNSSLRNCSSQ